MLLLAGSCETDLVGKGAFQELDAISLLSHFTRLSKRSKNIEDIFECICEAYNISTYSGTNTGFVDLPANVIQARTKNRPVQTQKSLEGKKSRPEPDNVKFEEAASLLRSAHAPLVVIGKGAAHARAEGIIRSFISTTSIPFLPSPMGKGVVPDSHTLNCASARSTVLQNADVVLVLCARLNWMFHFGESPKWNAQTRFIVVDSWKDAAQESSVGNSLILNQDINKALPLLCKHLAGWRYVLQSTTFAEKLSNAKVKNEEKAKLAATKESRPISFSRAFSVMKEVLHELSPPSEGGIVYVSEGANSMDISRSAFPVEFPRLRLDAGTNAAMGVGMGYAIAAHEAYNGPAAEASSGPARRKKIVAIEGDSAFGFSAMELETMARYHMDVLIFVMNNSGIYHGDANTSEEWHEKQTQSLRKANGNSREDGRGLRSTSLGWEVRYEEIAKGCGGTGRLARTSEELREATREGFYSKVPFVVNVVIESGKDSKLVSFYEMCPVMASQVLTFLEFRLAGKRSKDWRLKWSIKTVVSKL